MSQRVHVHLIITMVCFIRKKTWPKPIERMPGATGVFALTAANLWCLKHTDHTRDYIYLR